MCAWYGREAAEDRTYRSQLARELLAKRGHPPSAQSGAPGHVVEFLKSGGPLCGAVLRRGRHGDRVLDARGKPDFVPHDRIIDTSAAFVNPQMARHEIVQTLRSIDRERDRLKATIDPYELWEVVESEAQEWTLDELAALYFPGEPGPHGRAALFRALADGRAFRRHGKRFEPLGRSRLAYRRTQEARLRQNDAWLHETAAWLRRAADGEETGPPPDAGRAVELLAAKVIFGEQHSHAREATDLAKLAHFHTQEAIFSALVKVGHWSEDENLDLLRHNIPVAFAEQTIAEADAAGWTGRSGRDPRLWLRRVYSFAGTGGRHERAVSIRPAFFGFTVGVHFASPALLLQRGGLVQRAAADRTAALHLPDRLIPMLPQSIAHTAALREHELRPSLTVHMRFGSRFELKGHRFEICRASVNRPLPIQEANTAVERDWGLRKRSSRITFWCTVRGRALIMILLMALLTRVPLISQQMP